MTIAPLDITIIITYLLGVLGLGLFLGRGESADGFFVNNRKTRLFLLIFTALSTSVGSGTVIGVASASYSGGISFGISFAIAAFLAWLFMAWLAPRIKEWGDRLNAYTFGDFLAVRFSKRVRKLSIYVILTSYFVVTATQFVAFAVLAKIAGGISFELALTIAAVVTISYTIFAGIKGDIYTDAVQFFVMLPVFFFLFIKGLERVSVGEIFSSLPDGYLNVTSYGGPAFFVGAIIFGFGIVLVSVEVWQRVFAAASSATARKAFIYSAFLKVAAIFASMVFGLIAFKLLPDLPKDEAFFALMRELLPTGLLGIGFASVLAILMSTVDSTLMVGSATLTKDYYMVKHPGASEKKILLMGRIYVLLFGLGAYVVALLVQDIVRLGLTAVQIMGVFLPVLLGGLIWKKSSERAAFWTVLVGFLTTVFLLFVIPDVAAVPGIIISVIIFVLLSLYDSKKSMNGMLYILVGLPASGKSEVAKILAEQTSAQILNEDIILSELYPEPTHSHEERQKVYDEIFVRAKKFLKMKRPVILDATFINRENREVARGLSNQYKIIEVVADEELIKKRLKDRFDKDANDADWGVYLKYKQKFEPVLEHHEVIDNSKSIDRVREQIKQIAN